VIKLIIIAIPEETMENFDLYDRNRISTGEKIRRGQRPPAGRYHMIVHICVFNREGQMLIQQRSQEKGLWAGLWDVSLGGAAQAGDFSWQAAERELKEELGIHYDFSLERPAFTFNFEHGFDDFYLIQLEPELESLRLQADEVTAVRWASRSDIHKMIESGEFLPYHPVLIDLLFEMRFKPRFIDRSQK